MTSDKFDAADIMDEVSCICGVAVIGGFFSGDGECDTTDLAIEEGAVAEDTEPALRINPWNFKDITGDGE